MHAIDVLVLFNGIADKFWLKKKKKKKKKKKEKKKYSIDYR